VTLKGSAIEKISKPFTLRWNPGNPGRWEAMLDDGKEIWASSASPDVEIAIVIDCYCQHSEEPEE
jgi:hypothetical protein